MAAEVSERQQDQPPIKNFINYLGITQHVAFWHYFFFATIIFLSGFILWLLFEAIQKRRKILTVGTDCPWNKTYSVGSLYLVNAVIVVLVFQLFVKAIFLIELTVPDDIFQKWFLIDGDHLVTSLCSMNWDEYDDKGFKYYLKYLVYILPYYNLTFQNMIFLMQTQEWLVMLHLIRFQCNKSVEEIAYQLEAENVQVGLAETLRISNLAAAHLLNKDLRESSKSDNSLKMSRKSSTNPPVPPPPPSVVKEEEDFELISDRCGLTEERRLNFRKREICLRKFFWAEGIFYGLVGSLFFIVLFITIKPIKWGLWVFSAVHIYLFLAQNFVFISLHRTMRKQHRYEYERTKRSMLMQNLVSQFSSGTVILYSLILVLSDTTTISGTCLIVKDLPMQHWKYVIIQIILILSGSIIHMSCLASCFTIVKLKSSQDILQGISKLDYLIKASEFQREKSYQFKKEEDTESVSSATSFQRDETILGTQDSLIQSQTSTRAEDRVVNRIIADLKCIRKQTSMES